MAETVAIVLFLTAAAGLLLFFLRQPERDELKEADALNRLSEGFEWESAPTGVVFVCKDGSRVVFDRSGLWPRWYSG